MILSCPQPRTIPCLLMLLLLTAAAKCQPFYLQHGFAHNDYWHKRPLFEALENGYTYIEADVYLRRGQLVVAHMLPCLAFRRTLQALYLDPLHKQFSKDPSNRSAKGQSVTLMIDIKSRSGPAYRALCQLLERYKDMLSSYEQGKITRCAVTIVLSGHKPLKLVAGEERRLVFVDEDLRKLGPDPQGLFSFSSCRYASLIRWKGRGAMPLEDEGRLRSLIQQAHAYGRKVRLWGCPENPQVWKALLQQGVDLICTDRLADLKNFLLSSDPAFTQE